ncbi:lysylphosphatidylglycerol synthase transmembrane domain-containing protein [soil metagenome]
MAVRQVDVSESLRALGSVQPLWLVAATLVYLTSCPVRAQRWRLILRDQKSLSLGQTLVPLFVGYMANNLLPARAGELYRMHFLGRRACISRSGALASIVVERTFDGLMLGFFMMLTFLLFPEERLLGTAALVLGAIVMLLAAGIIFHVLRADRDHGLFDKGIELLPGRLEEFVSGRLKLFSRGMRGISTAGSAAEAGVYTVVIWGLELLAYTLAVLAFGVSLPLSGYLLVYTLAALGTALPSGPAYVGPYQYAFVLALGVFAVSRETALAVSVGAQVALLGSVTVVGLILLVREQLRGGLTPRQEPSQEKRVV